MSMKIADAFIDFKARLAGFHRNVRSAKKTMKDFADGVNKSAKQVKTNSSSLLTQVKNLKVGTLALYTAVAASMRSFVVASNRQEQAIAGMNQALKSMGRYSEEASENIQKLATQIQREGIIGDEEILRGTKFLITYKNITDDLLPRTMRIMGDLAALTGGDVTRAANLLGRASMGLTGELSRVGISLSEDTKKSKDFAMILRDIETQVRGQNKALAETRAGGLRQFANAIGDLKEKLGDLIKMGLLPIVKFLKPHIEWVIDKIGEILKKLENMKGLAKSIDDILKGYAVHVIVFNNLLKVTVWLGEKVYELLERYKWLNDLLTIINNPLSLITRHTDNFADALDYVETRLQAVWEFVKSFAVSTAGTMQNLAIIIKDTFTFQFAKLKSDWERLQADFVNVFKEATAKVEQIEVDYLKRKADRRKKEAEGKVPVGAGITAAPSAVTVAKEETKAVKTEINERLQAQKAAADELYRIEFGEYEDRMRIAKEEHQERVGLGVSIRDSVRILEYEITGIEREQTEERLRIEKNAAQKRIDGIMNMRDISEEDRLQRLESLMEETEKGSEIWKLYYNQVKQLQTDLAHRWRETTVQAMNIVKNAVSNALAAGIREGQNFKSVMTNIWQSMRDAFIQMVSEMITKWLMFQALTALGAPSWLTGGLKFWQEGGLVTKPTLGVAGESGPEMIVPLRKINDIDGLNNLSEMLPGMLGSMASKSAQREVTVNIAWNTSMDGAIIANPGDVDTFYKNVIQPAESRFKERITRAVNENV